MNRWRHAGGVGDFVTGTAVRSSGPEAHRDGARSFASGRGLRAVLPNRAPRYCPAYRHLVRDHHGNSGAEGNRSRSGTPERNPWMGEVRNHSVNSNRSWYHLEPAAFRVCAFRIPSNRRPNAPESRPRYSFRAYLIRPHLAGLGNQNPELERRKPRVLLQGCALRKIKSGSKTRSYPLIP